MDDREKKFVEGMEILFDEAYDLIKALLDRGWCSETCLPGGPLNDLHDDWNVAAKVDAMLEQIMEPPSEDIFVKTVKDLAEICKQWQLTKKVYGGLPSKELQDQWSRKDTK